MRPESLTYTPVSTLMSVDLPAPFCPIRACTSPRATSKRASRSAGTPRNCLLMPCIESSGAGGSATDGPSLPEDGAPSTVPTEHARETVAAGPGQGPVRQHRAAQRPGAAGAGSVGRVDVVGRVVLGEQLVGVDDQRGNRRPSRVVL